MGFQWLKMGRNGFKSDRIRNPCNRRERMIWSKPHHQRPFKYIPIVRESHTRLDYNPYYGDPFWFAHNWTQVQKISLFNSWKRYLYLFIYLFIIIHKYVCLNVLFVFCILYLYLFLVVCYLIKSCPHLLCYLSVWIMPKFISLNKRLSPLSRFYLFCHVSNYIIIYYISLFMFILFNNNT